MLAIGAPQEAGRTSLHKLAPADTAALAGKIATACAAMEGPVRVLLTYEAGYEGHADNRIMPHSRLRVLNYMFLLPTLSA